MAEKLPTLQERIDTLVAMSRTTCPYVIVVKDTEVAEATRYLSTKRGGGRLISVKAESESTRKVWLSQIRPPNLVKVDGAEAISVSVAVKPAKPAKPLANPRPEKKPDENLLF